MSDRPIRARAATLPTARANRERNERRRRYARSQGVRHLQRRIRSGLLTSSQHQRVDLLSIHSSLRGSSFCHHTISNSQYERTSACGTLSSSQQSNFDQDQFIDGQPTATLNNQRPGLVRTFSVSSSQHGQYDVNTTPNIAFMVRAASIASQGARRRLQSMHGSREASVEEGSVDVESTALNVAQSVDSTIEPHVEGIPSSLLRPHQTPYPMAEPTAHRDTADVEELARKQEESRGWLSPETHDRIGTSSPVHRDLAANEPCLEYVSELTSTTVRVKEVDGRDEEGLCKAEDKAVRLQTASPRRQGIRSQDFLGDSVDREEALIPPFQPRSSFHSRSSTPEIGGARTERLIAMNPDPPSASDTQDDLPLQAIPLELISLEPTSRHSTDRCRGDGQPVTASHPSPLRHQRTSSTRTNRAEEHRHPPPKTHNWDSRRNPVFPLGCWTTAHDRAEEAEANPVGEAFFANLLHDTAPSHWALYSIQGLIWLALTSYFFARVSQIENTVAFDCHELKIQFLNLGANITSSGNFTIGNAQYTKSNTEVPIYCANRTSLGATPKSQRRDASSIVIPKEYHDTVKGHCVLHPVNRAVVLGTHFEILLILPLVACGLAYLLEVLAFSQMRPWLVKSGRDRKRTVVVRIGVRAVAAGLASTLLVTSAWAIKGGWSD
ncbi:hypothetical protein BU23DRAFT_598598 [Bimuria novae-zelandiae CBS 107.79]|uniref:Transmembrane protein n=1 Tax=Bimuria novae-zelandiae CBS 107.79 TaxID=1447943 RepID=A0A6A5VG18_9PLEO|nr:hypothetical protein BU23DRAFT_598598 [Bimuria novae-zelandiae CBS 107.79]